MRKLFIWLQWGSCSPKGCGKQCGCWGNIGPGLETSLSLHRQQRWLPGLPGPFSFCLHCSRGQMGRIWKLPLGTQHLRSTCPLDCITQSNRTISSEDLKLWSSVHPYSPFWLPYCNERSRQSPVPQISWSSCLIIVSKDPTSSSDSPLVSVALLISE